MSELPRPEAAGNLRSALFADDLDVLSALPSTIKPGVQPVLFGSARWNLSGISTWPAYKPTSALLWDTISDPQWRVTAKETALLLMCPWIAVEHQISHARRSACPPWSLPNQKMWYWRRWFEHLRVQGVASLTEVTQDHCDSFLNSMPTRSRDIAISAVRAFSDYGPLLTFDAYRPDFRPWGGRTASAASGMPRTGAAENRTPSVPDRVFSPLLAACLHIIESLPADVRAATEHLARLESIATPWVASRHGFDIRLDAYIARLRAEGRMVPGRPGGGSIARTAIARHLGMRDYRHLARPDRWAKIQLAAEELGTRSGGGLYGLRPGVEFEPQSLNHARYVVRTACLVVVAGLSGMRHSELAEIRTGAVRREDLPSGQVRYRVASRLLKGEEPGGRREEWTVIEPVANALSVAETLTSGAHPLDVLEFASRFRELRDWVNEHAEQEGLEPIPTDWTVEPRQFRRTLSRELAWRPGGVIAAKVHLKHVSVATTEGYAGKRGESSKAFLAEVEAERRKRNREVTADVIRAIEQGEPVAGLGAKALKGAVAALHDARQARGAQVRDRDDALKTLIRTKADTLHITPLVYCWFANPDQARCLRDSPDKSKPLVGSCRPGRCSNATIHKEHGPTWISGLADLRSTLADRRVPQGERSRLSAKAAEMQAVLDAITGDQS